ncbi:MAG TPA: hypothetical protein VL574_17020, partial [Stellaceae bacterium]|nr:hypothetical protein [Stellaceae bacterium]
RQREASSSTAQRRMNWGEIFERVGMDTPARARSRTGQEPAMDGSSTVMSTLWQNIAPFFG